MWLGESAYGFTDRISRPEKLPDKSFVHDQNGRRFRGVEIGEVSPGEQGDFHRPEIARADPVELGVAFRAAGMNSERPTAAVKGNMRGSRRGFDYRYGPNLFQ